MTERIDLCSCYEPIITMPKEDYSRFPKVFYADEENGLLYFYIGSTRIQVSEFFNENGKSIENLIENLINRSVKI